MRWLIVSDSCQEGVKTAGFKELTPDSALLSITCLQEHFLRSDGWTLRLRNEGEAGGKEKTAQ
jgi:hypothetical protein